MNDVFLLKYNDNELLYLLKENSEEAMQILIKKYSIYIKLKIKQMNVEKSYYEEFYQEGLITLNRAIKTFDELNKSSFFGYFDLILTRKFIDIFRKISRNKKTFSNVEFEEYFIDDSCIKEELVLEEPINLSKLEKQVFDKKYRCYLKTNEIAQELGTSIKTIYGAVDRIKQKCKK